MVYDNGAATLDHVTVSDSASNGILAYALAAGSVTKLTITHATIANNAANGIYATTGSGTTNVAVTGSNIYGNGNGGIYNGNTSVTLNAENNWWGSDSGPAPYGSGNGINYSTCYDSVTEGQLHLPVLRGRRSVAGQRGGNRHATRQGRPDLR